MSDRLTIYCSYRMIGYQQGLIDQCPYIPHCEGTGPISNYSCLSFGLIYSSTSVFLLFQIIFNSDQIQLFGILDLEARALNLLFLVCRFYIYKTKMEQGVLQFALLKKQLQKYKTLEKYISIKNSKETFNKQGSSRTARLAYFCN